MSVQVHAAFFVACFAVAAVYFVVLAMWTHRRVHARSPAGVAERLRTHPNQPYVVKVGSTGSTWNPAKPLGINNAVWGPGFATYSIAADQTVYLQWQPKGRAVQHKKGPVPDVIDKKSPARRHARRIRNLVLGVYLVFTIVGFLVGDLLAHGTQGHRQAVGAFGAAAGYVCAYVGLMVAVGVMRYRQHSPVASR